MSEELFKSAVIHHSKKNFSKAKEIYETLLEKNPNNSNILQNYATLLSQIKEFKKADEIFKKCLSISLNDSLLLYNYGKFNHDQKNFNKAIEFYQKSFTINKKNDMPLYNIGNIYLSQNKFEKAIDFFKKTILVNPNNFMAYNNIGIAYKRTGNFSDAINSYKSAINLNNNYIDAHLNYGTILLTLNKLKEGFEEYEWRKKSKAFTDYIEYQSLNLESKVWNGENLENKKLFVISEQGIGDLIQFSRYLYLLKKKYKVEIILKIKSKKFINFFKKNDFKIIFEGEKIPNHDYHIFIVSLAKIFLQTNEIFCEPVNHFQSEPQIEKKWKKIFKDIQGKKIGIHWSTSSLIPERDLPLKYFEDLTKKVNASFFVLQKDVNEIDKKTILKNKNIFYFPNFDNSMVAFSDSIEIIKNLDLVITADTAVAHLSATLGKKTWVILPFVSDWRWFTKTKNSDWYPTVTLYRQKKIGEWTSIFKTIEGDLNSYIKLLNN